MFPLAGKPDEAVPPALAGYINREMAKAEALLKVVGSRPENLADNFATLLPSASAATFQRILELKVYDQGRCFLLPILHFLEEVPSHPVSVSWRLKNWARSLMKLFTLRFTGHLLAHSGDG